MWARAACPCKRKCSGEPARGRAHEEAAASLDWKRRPEADLKRGEAAYMAFLRVSTMRSSAFSSVAKAEAMIGAVSSMSVPT